MFAGNLQNLGIRIHRGDLGVETSLTGPLSDGSGNIGGAGGQIQDGDSLRRRLVQKFREISERNVVAAEAAVDVLQDAQISAEQRGIISVSVHDLGNGGIEPSRWNEQAHGDVRDKMASIRPVCPCSAR